MIEQGYWNNESVKIAFLPHAVSDIRSTMNLRVRSPGAQFNSIKKPIQIPIENPFEIPFENPVETTVKMGHFTYSNSSPDSIGQKKPDRKSARDILFSDMSKL